MNTHLKNGDVSAYGLNCGYVQSLSGDYYGNDNSDVMLTSDGCYHVFVRITGITHNENGTVKRVLMSDGATARADWATFGTLTAARRFYREIARAIKSGNVTDKTAQLINEGVSW